MRRNRCGQSDHQWKACHLPYQPLIAFGRTNGEPYDGKGKKRIQLTGKISTPCPEEIGDVKYAEVPDVNQPVEGIEGGAQSDPRFQWYAAGDHQDWYLDENVWMCRAWNADGPVQNPLINRGMVILDSGSSTTSTGTSWVKARIGSSE